MVIKSPFPFPEYLVGARVVNRFVGGIKLNHAQRIGKSGL
ncbi:MAG: hypothetical protein ACI9KS_001805, partial [Sulfitobacter sp.]